MTNEIGVLIERFRQKLKYTDVDFVRGIMDEIEWDARLIGIKGARGVGKTTLLLQYIKRNLNDQLDRTLYVTLDNIWFNEHSLIDLTEYFVKRGGKYLFIDEVHKYANWSQEIKNIYDDFPDLKVVFTGSSLLEISNARADLSRRAVIYHLQGLSFREYLGMELGVDFDTYSLDEILSSHQDISNEVVNELKPLTYFDQYLKEGYYPFYRELPQLYYSRLDEVINMMLEVELPMLRNMELAYVSKMKQLLYIIAESVPFTPNASKLSEKIGISRVTFLQYLHYLEEVGLTLNLYTHSGGTSKLQKPGKIYIENTNLIYSLSPGSANAGNIRETFFANQVQHRYQITLSRQSDFVVKDEYVFEIGGHDKSSAQIKGLKNAFIAADDIEFGYRNKIPLWLFGFLY